VFGAVELKRDGLVDGHSHGFRRGIAVVPNVDGNRFSLHVYQLMSASLYLRTEAEARDQRRRNPLTSQSSPCSEPEPTTPLLTATSPERW